MLFFMTLLIMTSLSDKLDEMCKGNGVLNTVLHAASRARGRVMNAPTLSTEEQDRKFVEIGDAVAVFVMEHSRAEIMRRFSKPFTDEVQGEIGALHTQHERAGVLYVEHVSHVENLMRFRDALCRSWSEEELEEIGRKCVQEIDSMERV